MDTSKSVARSTLSFLSGTFLSRLSGLGRDTTMAIVFGSQPAIAAFLIAFRFASLLRRLFGEGPLTYGFIPHFEQLRAEAPEKGALFFRDLFFSLNFFLIAVLAVLEAVLLGVLHFGNLQPDNRQILYLTALMLPGVLFICLFSLSSGILQCERKFFLTGFAPVAFNLVWIGSVLLLKDQDPTRAVFYLSLAIILAFFMQWAVLIPGSIKSMRQFLTWKQCFAPRLFSTEIRSIIKPFMLGIIGMGAVQINSTLDAIFARYASLEGPAYLWYAIRVEQLPLALFGIALSAALLPPLSRALKGGLYDQYLKLLRFAIKRSFSLIFPCALGLFALGISGINLLYGHGDFSNEAVYQTTLCLWGYGIGLVPSVFVLLLAPAFYADKNFRTPMRASVLSVILNIFLTTILVFGLHLGAFSIAIATGLSSWFNYFYLSFHLSKKLGQPIASQEVLGSFFKTALCSLIAACATLFVGKFFLQDQTLPVVLGQTHLTFVRDFKQQCLEFAALSGTFVLIFFSYARMLNVSDVLELIGITKSD